MQPLDRNTVMASLRNRSNPRLVLRPEDTPVPEHIPADWWPLLSLRGVDHVALAQLWGALTDTLPQTWQQLTRTLRGMAVLLEEGYPPALLYLTVGDGRLYHHRGQPPVAAGHAPARLAEAWSAWPAEARALYELHNGWSALFSLSMGHLPVAKIDMAYDVAGDIVADPGALLLDLRRTALVYANGAGSYLCLETLANTPARAFVWTASHPDAIGLQAGFAALYDAWTAIHFEEMDNA